MNELALICQSTSADAGGLARLDLPALHHRLQRNISSARDYAWPPPAPADGSAAGHRF